MEAFSLLFLSFMSLWEDGDVFIALGEDRQSVVEKEENQEQRL